MTVKQFKWLPHFGAGLRAGNLKLARQEIAPVGVFILITINPTKSWVGRCLQAMWSLCALWRITVWRQHFNATSNGGAGHVLPYGEQKVLLEPVFCEIFRNAWSMHCIAGGACRSAIQRRRVCWIIFVKAIQVMIMLLFCRNQAGFATSLQNHALLAFSTFSWNVASKLNGFVAYSFLIFCMQTWHTFRADYLQRIRNWRAKTNMYLTVCCIQIILPITLELTNQRISRNNEQSGESPELIDRLVSRNRAAFATDFHDGIHARWHISTFW